MSKTLTVRVPIPAPSTVLGANALGLVGIAAICVALAGLLGVWVGVLAAGVFSVALAYIASTHTEEAEPVARPAPLRNVS